MPICERCATENPTGSRFCGACGAALLDATEGPEARKVVTALFCDVVGSTALAEGLDPERLHGILSRYFQATSATIERHGGTVQKFAGDAVLAVFGIPRVHEDDALRAVRAAVEIREQLPALTDEVGVEIRMRTGINTGLVLTDEGRNLALGDAVNVAARLEQTALAGEIVLGAETLHLVRDAVEVEALEPLTLKGKAEPVAAFRLLGLDPTAPGVARRFDLPLVGREQELRKLREAWEQTAARSECHLLTLLGAAGVGKSRLTAELIALAADSATVLSGHCLPYGEGITFWPMIEALSGLGEQTAEIRERLRSGGAATPEELFWEVRRLLESLATERPMILHLDDLQWAEPMLLGLLEHVVGLSHAPILVVCTARPELLESHPDWGSRSPLATTIVLDPLGRSECEALLDQLGDPLEPGARARVIQASDGNPLFLQEIVAFARERGTVVVPPTIQALLAARLERLTAEEREPLERGAVEGQVFHQAAVRALLDERAAAAIQLHLAGLVSKDLIRPHGATGAGDDMFRFRHLLIRDASYERLPKAVRADLHERFAHWIERAGSDLTELDEIAGWHLEQAVRYRRELRHPVDPKLRLEAADRLYAAGQRAGDRSDVTAARSLLERARSLTPDGHPLGARIAVALAERLIEVGDLARADELLSLAEREDTDFGAVSLGRLEWLVLARPEQATEAVESKLPAMLAALAAAGDNRGSARAHMLSFWVHWAANRASLAAGQARLAAEHARRAGDMGLVSRALGWYVATLIYGPHDPVAMSGELDAIAREEPGPYLAAFVELGRGEVERLAGRFAEARQVTQRALDRFGELGMPPMAANCEQSMARIALSAGDPAVAVRSLLRCDAILEEFGERPQRSTTQALLARAQLLLGDAEAAAAAIELAERLSAPQDVINFAVTHEVRARLALGGGDFDAAERWARSAIEYAFRTDFVEFQGEARLGLARVLAAGGRTEEAASEAQAARGLFEVKGDQPALRACRSLP